MKPIPILVLELISLLSVVPLLAAEPIAEKKPATDPLANIAKVYSENREKLRAFTCRFKVTGGPAATTADGLAGKFVPTSIQNGLWIVSGGDVRYELLCKRGRHSRRA